MGHVREVKKNRRICFHCKSRIYDMDFRATQVCKMCGSSFCYQCAVDVLMTTTERTICCTCFKKDQTERKIENAILSRGW